jgi:hypothetical protein
VFLFVEEHPCIWKKTRKRKLKLKNKRKRNKNEWKIKIKQPKQLFRYSITIIFSAADFRGQLHATTYFCILHITHEWQPFLHPSYTHLEHEQVHIHSYTSTFTSTISHRLETKHFFERHQTCGHPWPNSR